MMAFRSLHRIRGLHRTAQISESPHLLGSSRSYASGISTVPELYCRNKGHGALPWTHGSSITLRSAMAVELPIFWNDTRLLSTQVKSPAQARQMGALKVAMLSPGFIYEPYTPREKISFLKRWFTRSGWRRTKEDIVLELKSAYAITKLRKKGYSKNLFYKEAIQLYKEINTLMANGDKNSLRKAVTEKMFSELKNEIKQRDSIWNKVYWEMVEPVVKIRTLRARLIGVDRNDLEKVFIQLTLEFLTKQKFEAYDSNGSIVSGDKSKEGFSMAKENEAASQATVNGDDTHEISTMSSIGVSIINFQNNLLAVGSTSKGSGCGGSRSLLNHYGEFLGLDSKRVPNNPAASQFVEALAKAWTEYNNPRAVVMFVVQADERNMYDQHWLSAPLKEIYPF
ncbi:Hypothetical predicted protein [Prunus dulcis]|uniref:Large ribosomal subunit protein mL45 n=1 Tax=Prunus dulcis TaxID=3755 RepID=A0A5E4EAJ5_PRUDU|nr:Hypothetical predicted protein [Prunus dulcis]